MEGISVTVDMVRSALQSFCSGGGQVTTKQLMAALGWSAKPRKRGLEDGFPTWCIMASWRGLQRAPSNITFRIVLAILRASVRYGALSGMRNRDGALTPQR